MPFRPSVSFETAGKSIPGRRHQQNESTTMQSNKTIVPILNGDQTVEDWKRILSKMTAFAAAEIVISNYLYDPLCDYGTSVRVLRKVLTAWSELELEAHGIGGKGDHAPKILA
jgi:hypothetical protein